MKDRIALRMVEDAERDGLLKQVDEGMVVDDRDGLLKQVDDWDDEDDYDGKHELTVLSILQLAVQ